MKNLLQLIKMTLKLKFTNNIVSVEDLHALVQVTLSTAINVHKNPKFLSANGRFCKFNYHIASTQQLLNEASIELKKRGN